MEAAQPFLQPSLIGIDFVEVEIRCLGVWFARHRQNVSRDAGPTCESDNCRAAIAAELVGGGDDTIKRRGNRHTFNFGSTASVVAPWRSRATITGICSADRPRLADLPPLLRDFRGMPDRLPLNNSKMNVSSPSTIPVNALGLSPARDARNRCRQRNAVV